MNKIGGKKLSLKIISYEWDNSCILEWEASNGPLWKWLCPMGKADPEGDAAGNPEPICPGDGDGL